MVTRGALVVVKIYLGRKTPTLDTEKPPSYPRPWVRDHIRSLIHTLGLRDPAKKTPSWVLY